MTDSILISVKESLGVEGTTHFDGVITESINSAFFTLNQIGVGPAEGFAITGTSEVWSDYIPDTKVQQCVKTYVFLKVRMVFDPPAQSFLLENFKTQIAEFEWRLRVDAEQRASGGTGV